MNKIKLSKRLMMVASVVTGDVVCDVGCDHGKLSYYLLKNNLVKFAYVSDISKPSLEKAEKLLSENSLNFESIHCDGLLGFKGKKVDECIITGMGGDEIINIISKSPIKINSFTLSPQHNIIEVKKFMLKKGYNILFDKIIKDGHKFYNIFKCVMADNIENYSEINLLFGKDYLEEKNDIRDYLKFEWNKINNLYNKVNDQRREELAKYLEMIKKAQKDWNL